MYAGDSAPAHSSPVEQAGILDIHSLRKLAISNHNGPNTPPMGTRDLPQTPGTPGAEQALNWQEVIELQTFSERKAWIEEKIKVCRYIDLYITQLISFVTSSWRKCLP